MRPIFVAALVADAALTLGAVVGLAWVLSRSLGACAWIEAHDPPATPTMTKDCTGLGEERCGINPCCDGWHGYHCSPSGYCEWVPGTGFAPTPLDAGKDSP